MSLPFVIPGSTPRAPDIEMRVYDLRGRIVAVRGGQGKMVRWCRDADDGRRVPSGVYFCRVMIESEGTPIVVSKRINIVR